MIILAFTAYVVINMLLAPSRSLYANPPPSPSGEPASIAVINTLHLPIILRSYDPTRPRMLSPLPGAEVGTLIPEFEFDFGGPHPESAAGVLEFSTNPDPGRPGVYATFWLGSSRYNIRPITNLLPASIYYWRVGLIYDYDYSSPDWTEQITFTTPSNGVILPAPALSAPISGSVATTNSLVLEWTPVVGAVEYQVIVSRLSMNQGWIATTSDANLVVGDSWLASELIPGNRYEWYVSARNDYAWSAYSDVRQFVVAPAVTSAGGERAFRNHTFVLPGGWLWAK
ncbi:MAG: fibronectin type III domain-containing protein [Caldilinea sp.]|nr:fibronectin type III domain-containing protein [Caldilinea sp.]